MSTGCLTSYSISSNSDTTLPLPSLFSGSIRKAHSASLLPRMKPEPNDFIDLCSSPEDSKLFHQVLKTPVHLTTSSKYKPFIIDLCSPKSPIQPASVVRSSKLGPIRSVKVIPGLVSIGSVYESWEDAREAGGKGWPSLAYGSKQG
jgi:hypothetical protein